MLPDPSNNYNERIQCINNPDFVSKDDGNYKYCIRDNGEILKIDKEGDIKIIEGEIDKIIKNKKLEFIITTTSLIEYQIENHELVEYRCTAKKVKSKYICKDTSQRFLLGIRPNNFFLNLALLNIDNNNWQLALENLK